MFFSQPGRGLSISNQPVAELGRARGLLRKFTQNRTTAAVNDCRGGFRPLDGSLNRFRERLAELCSYLTAKQTRIDCRRIGGLSDAEETDMCRSALKY